MREDEARCTGYPEDRDTVRPCELCRDCARWQQRHQGERVPFFSKPPANETPQGVVLCNFYRAD